MTRLIDADSIPWEVDGVGEIPVITKEEIDEMPTVDAVPVEYILKQIVRLERSKGQSYHAICYRNLVEAWKMRNERKEK